MIDLPPGRLLGVHESTIPGQLILVIGRIDETAIDYYRVDVATGLGAGVHSVSCDVGRGFYSVEQQYDRLLGESVAYAVVPDARLRYEVGRLVSGGAEAAGNTVILPARHGRSIQAQQVASIKILEPTMDGVVVCHAANDGNGGAILVSQSQARIVDADGLSTMLDYSECRGIVRSIWSTHDIVGIVDRDYTGTRLRTYSRSSGALVSEDALDCVDVVPFADAIHGRATRGSIDWHRIPSGGLLARTRLRTTFVSGGGKLMDLACSGSQVLGVLVAPSDTGEDWSGRVALLRDPFSAPRYIDFGPVHLTFAKLLLVERGERVFLLSRSDLLGVTGDGQLVRVEGSDWRGAFVSGELIGRVKGSSITFWRIPDIENR